MDEWSRLPQAIGAVRNVYQTEESSLTLTHSSIRSTAVRRGNRNLTGANLRKRFWFTKFLSPESTYTPHHHTTQATQSGGDWKSIAVAVLILELS